MSEFEYEQAKHELGQICYLLMIAIDYVVTPEDNRELDALLRVTLNATSESMSKMEHRHSRMKEVTA